MIVTTGKSKKFAIKEINENPPKNITDKGITAVCDDISTDSEDENSSGKNLNKFLNVGAKTIIEKHIVNDNTNPAENSSVGDIVKTIIDASERALTPSYFSPVILAIAMHEHIIDALSDDGVKPHKYE